MLSVISENLALLKKNEPVRGAAQAQLEQMAIALQRGSALATRLVRYRQNQELQPRPGQINDVVNVALRLIDPLLKGRMRVKAELESLPVLEIDAF